jgi:hypothetical protein
MEAEMKARVLTVAALFAVVMIFSAAPASAQGISKHARFLVPFEFSVGDKVLPAGEYIVIGESTFIRVRSQNGKQSAIALPSRRTAAWGRVNEVALTFRLYGDQYHLTQVWLPDGIGRELRDKRQVEPKLAKNVKTVEISAR